MSKEMTSLMNKAANWIIQVGSWIIQNSAMLILVIILIVMAWGLFSVGFAKDGGEIAKFFGIDATNKGKKETIKFIALGMSGVVAAIVAVAVNRRAKAQERNNELIEKGHDNERFQNMTSDLGHGKITVRIATFHRFYYLASKNKGGNPEQLRKDIFEMLCSYLRAMPDEAPKSEENNKSEYIKECQTLFDILFKDKFKSNNDGLMPNDFPADLQKINLSKIDPSNANLSNTNLSNANLSNANLSHTNLLRANLSNANLTRANLTRANLSSGNPLSANIGDAELRRMNLSLMTIVSLENLSGANLSGADLSDANLSDADLSGADLSGARFTNAWLVYANFRGAKLKSEQLQYVLSFDGADFRDTGIKLADLPSGKGAPITDE